MRRKIDRCTWIFSTFPEKVQLLVNALLNEKYGTLFFGVGLFVFGLSILIPYSIELIKPLPASGVEILWTLHWSQILVFTLLCIVGALYLIAKEEYGLLFVLVIYFGGIVFPMMKVFVDQMDYTNEITRMNTFYFMVHLLISGLLFVSGIWQIIEGVYKIKKITK